MNFLMNYLFSMRIMTLGLLIFGGVIGWATFLESWYGTQTSKAIVYNAAWFVGLLVYMCFGMVANIFRYNLWAREKIALLMFHLSFIVIIIGAGVTRYIGFEGLMLIRENSQSNIIHSADAYVQIYATDGKMEFRYDKSVLMTDVKHPVLRFMANNKFSESFKNFDKSGDITITYDGFIANAVDQLEKNVSDGQSILEIITPSPKGGMDTNYVAQGTTLTKEGFVLAYDYPNPIQNAINIHREGNNFTIQAPADLNYMLMSDQSQGTITADSVAGFFQGRLYTFVGQNFVFKAHHPNAKLTKVKSTVPDTGIDVLYLNVESGKEKTRVALEGGQSRIPFPTFFELDGIKFRLAYGAKPVETPFYIFLRDFELERYPGSDSPASYASEITVIDEKNKVQFDKRIFMNSVMDYQGYRFFQSSYDPDELGTRLSVNSDFWGTNISYFGYLLMIVGMIFTFFSPASRFLQANTLIRKMKDRKAQYIAKMGMLALLVAPSFGVFAQDNHEHFEGDGHQHEQAPPAQEEFVVDEEFIKQQQKINATPLSLEHAKKLETLVIQDFDGRFKPLQTLALDILHKVHRKDTYNGLTATQVLMEVMFNLDFIKKERLIAVNHPEIREKLGIQGKYATYVDFFDKETDEYILEQAVAEANQKPEGKRNEWDKQVIKVNERVQILGAAVFYLRIFPVRDAPNNTWFTPFDPAAPYQNVDSLMPKFFIDYVNAVRIGKLTGDYKQADESLELIRSYQKAVAGDLYPSEQKINMEIRYNEMRIFKRVTYVYLLFGFGLLVVFFISVFTFKTKWTKVVNVLMLVGIIAGFIIHGIGLGMRWYISGHAPWSDGYEALLFIAWVGVLAGLLFAKKSMAALGATGILAFFLLYVAHLNNLDPQITNLVPVLQSYWLKIHVAVITGSYAFLGLGAVLAIVNLLLYIFKTAENKIRLSLHIEELSYIIEMTSTIGLFMLTIGTFLGGIWANESWGRYWGWDPKETWALVSILVYAVLLHLRFIPALKGKLVFNSVAMWSYSAILFTYFGVNFFLVGLHSYANGEAETIWPSWLTYVVLIFVVFNALAIWRDKAVR
jgi:cytochrome c-type biogenesis protein CcsB